MAQKEELHNSIKVKFSRISLVKSLYNTYNVKMSLAADIHGIKAEHGTRKSRKSHIKLHFQKEKEKHVK